MESLALILTPIVVAVIIIVSVSVNSNVNQAKFEIQTLSLRSIPDLGSDTCTCPTELTTNPCSVVGDAALGGVDFVEYFTTFKLPDGTYNESETGAAGLPEYNSSYDGFLYYFVSESNKQLFDENPTAYIPQWGGYCAWGIAGEFCAPYPWAADCLGPSGNWGHWTIQNEKLYFFLFALAKSHFMNDTDVYISQGDERWSGWFEDSDAQMSTRCYVGETTSESFVGVNVASMITSTP